jgi:hypothetical protein
MLIFHFLGLALSLGSMITFLVMRRSCSKVTVSESDHLLQNTKSVLRLSHIGLGIMFITGGALMTPYWANLAHMPFLHIKFTIFILWYATLVALSIYTRKARKSELKLCNPRIGFLSYISILFGLLAISMGVMQFQ